MKKTVNFSVLFSFFMGLLLFSSESFATNLFLVTDRAAIGQDVYNWIQIDNNTVSRVEYYVDGMLNDSSTQVSNKRIMYNHRYNSPGTHFFTIKFYLPDGTVKTDSRQTVVYTPTKNLAGALDYAEYYALRHNDSYRYFEDLGDCTNFISQILYEGGGFSQEWLSSDPLHNWYYLFGNLSGLMYSTSWTVVADFYSYMWNYKGIVDAATHIGNAVVIDGVKTYQYPPLLNGGVIRYDFPSGRSHNAFVVGSGFDSVNSSVTKQPEPLVNYHSTDSWHIAWTLASRNTEWLTTKVTDNRIKWDFQ